MLAVGYVAVAGTVLLLVAARPSLPPVAAPGRREAGVLPSLLLLPPASDWRACLPSSRSS